MKQLARISAVTVAVFATAVLLGGCTSTSDASSIAKTASKAAASAQTAAYDLRLNSQRKTTFSVSDTALSDATKALQQVDSTLTSAQTTGAVQASANKVLSLVRAAEDQLQKAQAPSPSNAALVSLSSQLHREAVRLTSIASALEASR
jgi:hypothetical protein